jgi:hypothetical protein
MPQAASLPKRFTAEDTSANEVDASVKSDKGRSAIAKHPIKVPMFSYLPPVPLQNLPITATLTSVL